MKVHHIGYLVEDLAAAEKDFLNLGFALESGAVYDEYRQVDIAFLVKDGVRVELVAPRPDCQLFKSLKKRIGNSPYHICYASEDYASDAAGLTKNGYTQIAELMPAPALGNSRVAFFYSASSGMLELIE